MGYLARGYRARTGVNEMSNARKCGLNSQTLLVIKLPDSWVVRIVSRSLFLALVLMALPSLGHVMTTSSSTSDITTSNVFKILPVLLRDLVDEGLIKKGQKGLVLGTGIGEIDEAFEFLKNCGIDLVADDGIITTSLVFDFLFVRSLSGVELIDRSLKDGSIVISQFGNDLSKELRFLGSYKVVYLRRFEYTVMAIKKVGVSQNGSAIPPARQASYSDDKAEEEKKAALKGLEDAFLEPPTRALLRKRSRFTSRKIKFLPDLLKDSLEEYPRRVFISDDKSASEWFYKNYPMRDQEFEVYDMEIIGNSHKNDHNGGIVPQEAGVSAWLMKNVRQKDYVVMKAEAEVVEEMLKDKTICLVDELFLECKNQWQHGKNKMKGSKRAYWQCLALYGKVRDEGIAVHQWWN
ncbi:hypothetical protein F511_05379 [Dorcoceras hygrometricum]|uniref:DUF7870 domain-containing protein n=1 Tax=Dorcoceras hygrometricum TaxID=472368 RepID=A0A2Z7ATR9_9LAMI|nr:hypothetical protein F511_05379 [Dorcoceras hygrometricum]